MFRYVGVPLSSETGSQLSEGLGTDSTVGERQMPANSDVSGS